MALVDISMLRALGPEPARTVADSNLRRDVFSITVLQSDVPARTPGGRDAAGQPNKMKLERMEEMIVPQDTRADPPAA
ncbi:uncharacterized protein N7477_008627 [Penicillium maclennaniae]|uniref:uncharacterized protein n=1 Tax=Penicillium maclennaniae TaxID=1343394 RepID=UPI00254061D4|nr:uncharacterized protein N7477_008627 [Penicillium maclennaniae]KAJ5666179.1 hypothetical protein N7477_008627 [Penicillium maclennaniae]